MARVANLYLFAGESDWEKTEALRKLKARHFPEAASSLAWEAFEGKEKDFNPERVLSVLATVPFESSGRLILIKDIEKTPPPFQSRLLDAVRRLPKRTLCVLETKQTQLKGPFFEKLALLGTVSLFVDPKGPGLSSWIDQRASFYGKKITSSAKAILLEKGDGTPTRLDKHLESLATYVGEKMLIEEKEVEALVGPSLAHTSFELARAIAAREALKALTIFNRLVLVRTKPQEIVGIVGWQLRRMLRAKELLEEGISPTEIGRDLRLRWQEQETFFDCLSRFERSELEEGLRQLLKVDQRLKTGLGEEKQEVERFVLGLCR